MPTRGLRPAGGRPPRPRRPRRRSLVLGAALGLLALVVAACGSSGGSTGSGGGTSAAPSSAASPANPALSSFLQDAAIVKLAENNPSQALKELYAGQWAKPPSAGPKAVTGKNVWMLSCGQIYVACAEQATAFQQAGKVLGWHVTIFDTKASTDDEVTGIDEAIAAHASAIVMPGQDCGSVEAPLQRAVKAGIFVINDLSSDCNEPSGQGPVVYNANILDSGYSTWIQFQEAWQSARLAYVIAKTKGPVNIIELTNTQKVSELYDNDGFDAAVTACSRCHVVDHADYTFTQVADNQLGQVVSSALESHPEANVMSINLDALMPLGVATALEQYSGKRPILIGSEGLAPNWAYMRQDLQTASVAIDYVWQTWAAADVINRLLAGEKESQIPSEGLGFQAVDKTHNLPAGSNLFVAPVNYKAVYTKVWTGQ